MEKTPIPKRYGEQGSSIVVLVIGMGLSLMAMLAASKFLFGARMAARNLNADTEATMAWSTALRMGLKDDVRKATGADVKNCMRLIVFDARFERSPPDHKEVGFLNVDQMRDPAQMKKLLFFWNKGSKDYIVQRLSMIQRSPMIGVAPSRVLADLKIRVTSTINPTEGSSAPFELSVPMMLELDEAGKVRDCMAKPTPESICKDRGKTFSAGDAVSACQ